MSQSKMRMLFSRDYCLSKDILWRAVSKFHEEADKLGAQETFLQHKAGFNSGRIPGSHTAMPVVLIIKRRQPEFDQILQKMLEAILRTYWIHRDEDPATPVVIYFQVAEVDYDQLTASIHTVTRAGGGVFVKGASEKAPQTAYYVCATYADLDSTIGFFKDFMVNRPSSSFNGSEIGPRTPIGPVPRSIEGGLYEGQNPDFWPEQFSFSSYDMMRSCAQAPVSPVELDDSSSFGDSRVEMASNCSAQTSPTTTSRGRGRGRTHRRLLASEPNLPAPGSSWVVCQSPTMTVTTEKTSRDDEPGPSCRRTNARDEMELIWASLNERQFIKTTGREILIFKPPVFKPVRSTCCQWNSDVNIPDRPSSTC